MKTRNTLSMALLTIGSILGFPGRREECHNGTHANGIIPLVAEVNITTRYLLVQKGTAADGFIVNTATTRPLGVCLDEPTGGRKAAVGLLGCMPGTIPMVASKAIAAGSKLWTATGGKVTDTYAAGAFFCGRSVTTAAADGDRIEAAHCMPMLDASGTTL